MTINRRTAEAMAACLQGGVDAVDTFVEAIRLRPSR